CRCDHRPVGPGRAGGIAGVACGARPDRGRVRGPAPGGRRAPRVSTAASTGRGLARPACAGPHPRYGHTVRPTTAPAPRLRRHDGRSAMTSAAMIETYPGEVEADHQRLSSALDALIACAQTCTACADACLAEQQPADLRACIRLNLDCADICGATARVFSRHTAGDPTT